MPPEEINFDQPVTDPAPIEPEAPEAETVAAEVETEAEGEKASPEQESEDKQRDSKGRFRGIQPRIDELTRARHEAEREAAYWKGVAEANKAPAKAEGKPEPGQFEDHNEYVEKLAEWKAQEIVRAELGKRDQEATQQKRQAEQQTRATTWESRQAEFSKTAPDFAEVVASADIPMPAHVMDALLESEHGPALAYHLAKNPDVATKIGGMSERAALIELGALQAKLANPTPVQKSVTKAPAPITPIKSGGNNVVDLNKMSQAEYEAYRAKQGAWWGKRG